MGLCRGFVSVCLIAWLATGCASSFSLMVPAEKPLVDDGSRAPELAEKQYKNAIVLPPTEGTLISHSDLIERCQTELMRSGVGLISSAKAAELDVATDKLAAGGEADIEAALQPIKESGADIALVVSSFQWSDAEEPSRFFVLEPENSGTFREVERSVYQLAKGQKYALASPTFSFKGALIDVQSLKKLASFDIGAAANWQLPAEYSATLQLREDDWVITDENFHYEEGAWIPDAKKAVERAILKTVADSLKPPVEALPVGDPEEPTNE